MGKPKDEKPLTHEEIWDDSSLVRSWEDAVEEYQHYHSIHAKGEKVEDVLKDAEENGLDYDKDPVAEEPDVEDVAMTGAVEEESCALVSDTTDTAAKPSSDGAEEQPAEVPTDAATQGSKTSTSAMPMPEPILAHVQDENLKRLMMSWYYAGYYTGLYEGQQQARSSKS